MIPAAPLSGVGIGNALKTWLLGLNCPIRLAVVSVKYRLPSAPAVITAGPLSGVGIGNITMPCVAGLSWPIALMRGAVK